jgi:hypothetical protein
MNGKTGYSILIKAAAALLKAEFLLSEDPFDYRQLSMSRLYIAKKMERSHDICRGIAVNVREGADAQAAEITRLRSALVGLIGEDNKIELLKMERNIVNIPVETDAENQIKVVTINAIRALIEMA